MTTGSRPIAIRVLRGLFVALIVAFAVAAIAVTALLSPYGLHAVRDDVAAWASGHLGRALRIDGDLQLSVGHQIVVTATSVRLANAEWGRRPDMLTADRVLVAVDTASLLSRAPLVIDQIEVAGLDLLLERTATGEQNWEVDGIGGTRDDDTSPLLSYVVDRVDIPGARIQFIGPRLDRPLNLRLDELRQQRGTSDMLELTASGRANDVDLTLTGRIGPFDNLIAAKSFNVSIDGRVGELSLAVGARIDDLAHPNDSEINVDLRAPDARYVATTLGVRNLGEGPFSLALSISPALDGKGVRGSIVGRIGEFDVSGDGELDEPDQMGKLTLRTQISGPDVSLLAGLAGVDLLPPERFKLTATIRRAESVLVIDAADLELPDSALHLKGSITQVRNLSGNDLTVHISGADIEKFRALFRIPGLASGPFEASARIRPSGKTTDFVDFNAQTTLMTLSATGELGGYPDFTDTRLQVTINGNEFGRVAPFFGLRADRSGAFSGRGRVEWTPSGLVLHAATLDTPAGTLKLDGRLGRTSQPAGDVRFGMRGKSLSRLADMAGWSGLPSQPYALDGQLSWSGGVARFEEVEFNAAGARLSVSGVIGRPPQWHRTALSFAVDGTDLGAFAGLVPDFALPAGPFRARGALAVTDNRLQLRNISAAVAGANATFTTDTMSPLSKAVGEAANRFDVQAKGPDLKALIPDLPEHAAARQEFDIDAKGSWTTGRWTFDTLRVDTPLAFVHVQGTLDRAPDYSATAMNAEVRSDDLAQTGALFGVELPSGALNATATIAGSPTAFRLDPLNGRFDQSDFVGRVGLDLTAKPVLDVDLQSESLDLTRFVPSLPTPPATVVGTRRTIPDVALPLALLERIDGRFVIASKATRFLDTTYADLDLRAELKDGHLTVDPLAFGSTDGNLRARFVVGPVATVPNVTLVATGDDIQLGVIPGMNVTAAASRYHMQIDLAASGDNLRSLAATLNGRTRFVGAGARIPASRVSALSSDFMGELLRTLNPVAKRHQYTDVVCQAYLFRIRDGVLKTDPAIAVRMTDVDIVSNGTIDLSTEAIDFNFKTAARKGLGFSAGEFLNPYVKVGGTLAKPQLTLDPKGTLVTGGAAFATGGLSILATTLWDRLARQKDPCAAAVAESDRRNDTAR
jgi:hypothetical protein